MLQNRLLRYFHSSVSALSSINKSQLAKLRKKTGYTFSNCKKALELNDNDVLKAEKWLQEQAQALGWSKLSKLEGRATAQGLIGVAQEGKRAAFVEMNCETDFVARNKTFKEAMVLVSSTCLEQSKKIQLTDVVTKDWFDSEQLKSFEAADGKKLMDHVALLVSSVGENILLKRALTIGVKSDLNLACYVHPDESQSNNIMIGKYGAVIVYDSKKNDASTSHLIRQLCQHVIGMNPKTVKKDPNAIASREEEKGEGSENKDTDKNEENEKEEDALMSQDFLLDPSITVEELLTGSGINIVDFVRFETGEKIKSLHTSEPELKAAQSGG